MDDGTLGSNTRRETEGGDNTEENIAYGIREKEENSDWRILIGNINTFPKENNGENKAKLDLFKHLVTSNDCDILLLSEHNMNVLRTEHRSRPGTLMRNWWQNSISRFEWLKSTSESQYEQGGTAIITNTRSSAHTIAAGCDTRKMGRWNWITLRGKENTMTTIISIYRPRENQATSHRQLARLRHEVYGDIRDVQPHILWVADLSDLIREKKGERHQVLVAGDFNDDLNDDQSKISQMMRGLGLRNLLKESNGSGPNTYNRGTKTIDGAFATDRIKLRKGNYSTFEESPSDHRFYHLDIEEDGLVGTSREDRPPPLMRKATSKIPSVKRAFNQLLEAEVKKHNLRDKMDEIYKHAVTEHELTTDMKLKYEQVEERIRRAIKDADRHCRTHKRKSVPFSAKQKELMGAIRVLKVARLRFLLVRARNRPKARMLQRMAKKYNYKGELNYATKEEYDARIKDAATAYDEFRPKAHKFRETYLVQIAEEMAEEDGKEVDFHLTQLINRERVKEHFRRIKRSEGRNRRSGVDKVMAETMEGLQMVFGKKEIEDAIIDANKEKLQQANNTPFRMEPLQSLLGEQMEYEKWEKILKKEIDLPEDVEEGTRLWYEYIQNFDENTDDITWTTEEYCDSWKKMQEDKASLPGIHSAHMKCLDSTTAAAEVISRLALVPLLTGYAPTQWKKGLDSMIPKKEGEWRPGKLRLILLLDARFNHNNKLIGKAIMNYGEKHGILAPEQYGSRKDRSAIEHAINKRLTIDITRQAKIDAIYMANDATSCYDRIILMITYLTMRHYGISEPAATSSIGTLCDMEHRVRTTYGVSEESYGGTEWSPKPHGIGQGNGYAPALWAGISSLMLKVMSDKGYGTKLRSPISKIFLHMAGYSFVDDTDFIETALPNETWESLFDRAQEGLRLWETLLRTTGGAIEPTKSHWVRISHKWKNGKSSLEKANRNEHLELRDPQGNTTHLQQIEVTESKRTLGVWQAACGDETAQKTILIKKIEDWGEKTSTKTMTKHEARTAIKQTIGRTIRYPLAATALNKAECIEIQKVLKKETIGKMGVVRTAPNAVVNAPTQFGGMGQTTIHENQTIDHVLTILQHGHSETVTGNLLRTTLEYMALESGMPGDPMKLPIHDITWISEKTWMDTTLRAMDDIGITIETNMTGLKKWTNNDSFLMERASSLISGKEIAIFNKVRMHLKAATFSDILTADGRQVDTSMLKGEYESTGPNPSRDAYDWPIVPPPTAMEKRKWTETICTMYGVTQNNRRVSGTITRQWGKESSKFTQWS